MSTAGRTLVLCFDGTTNTFDQDNTNVIRFFDLLKKDDPEKQMVYYQPGIGTYASPGMWMPLVIQLSKLADEAFAWFLDNHIMGGYKFLMQNWRQGDRICLFGFSRGAYTARCLAGMLHKVGLLPSSNQEQVAFAYTMYKNNSKNGWAQSAGFAKTFSRTVTIEFVGCWETVSSVGVIYSRHLPFSSANTIIKTFRHALALDEHRVRFQPNLWHRESDDPSAAKMDPEHASNRKNATDNGYDTSMYHKTDVEEVWFAGCHSDVGGGAVSNSTPHSLAFVPLRWMIEQTIRTQTSIQYNPGALKSVGITTSPFIETNINTLDRYWTVKAAEGIATSKNGTLKPLHRHGSPLEKRREEESVKGVEKQRYGAGKKEAEEEPINGASGSGSGASSHLPSPCATGRGARARETHATDQTLTGTASTRTHGTIRRLLSRKSASSSIKNRKTSKDATNQTILTGETEKERQTQDALSPINDPLKKLPVWWLLEIFPMVESYQDAQGRWHRKIRIHFGRARHIVDTDEPLVHISVKERMESRLKYKPRAKLLEGFEKARWTE